LLGVISFLSSAERHGCVHKTSNHTVVILMTAKMNDVEPTAWFADQHNALLALASDALTATQVQANLHLSESWYPSRSSFFGLVAGSTPLLPHGPVGSLDLVSEGAAIA
jgi:hypothetical protein